MSQSRGSYTFIFDSILKPRKLLLGRSSSGFTLPEIQPEGYIEHSSLSQIDIHDSKSISMGEMVIVHDEMNYLWVELEKLEKLPGRQGIYLCQVMAYMWEGMPHQGQQGIKNISLPRFLKKVNNTQEVIFYGGSFNPWHMGHETCIKQCPTENVVVVPDFNPWKAKSGIPVFGPGCRWASLRELALKYRDHGFSFYPGFWGVETPNPTASWIPRVKYQQKSLVIGDDNFMSFDKWKNIDVLFSELENIYVIPRKYSLLDLKRKKSELEILYNKSIFQIMLPHQYQEISSTKIRSEQAINL